MATALALTILLLLALFNDRFWWLVFITGFSIGGGIEFSNILYKKKLIALRSLVVVACFLFPVNAYLQINDIPSIPQEMIFVTIFLAAPALFVFSRREVEEFHTSVPMAIFGSTWIGFLLSFLIYVRYMKIGPYHYGIQLIFFFVYVIACADTGAYYIGKTFGRNKLSPLYSPNKTWEGVAGSFIGGLAGALLSIFTFAPLIPMIHATAMTLLLVVMGILGDLTESVLKRSCKVKDAGGILPGHGGILDRMDGVLLAAPVYFFYLNYVMLR